MKTPAMKDIAGARNQDEVGFIQELNSKLSVYQNSALSPTLTGAMFAAGAFAAPLVACGVLKIAYDLALYAASRRVAPHT